MEKLLAKAVAVWCILFTHTHTHHMIITKKSSLDTVRANVLFCIVDSRIIISIFTDPKRSSAQLKEALKGRAGQTVLAAFRRYNNGPSTIMTGMPLS
jgi:hypothetical protein